MFPILSTIFHKLFKGQIQEAYMAMNGYYAPVVAAYNPDMQFDPRAGGLRVLQSAHMASHLGFMFDVFYMTPEGSPVANDDGFDILVVASPNRSIAMTFAMHAGGDCEIHLYRGVTTSADGTPIPANNTNQESSLVSESAAYHTPTVTDLGTEQVGTRLMGGTGGQAVGGSTVPDIDRIYVPGTKVLIRLTNRSGQAQPMGIHMQWLEPRPT